MDVLLPSRTVKSQYGHHPLINIVDLVEVLTLLVMNHY